MMHNMFNTGENQKVNFRRKRLFVNCGKITLLLKVYLSILIKKNNKDSTLVYRKCLLVVEEF